MASNLSNQLGRLTADQLTTITYESGFNSDLTLAGTSYAQFVAGSGNVPAINTVQSALQAGGTISFGFFNTAAKYAFTTLEINNAIQALTLWSGMANINFAYQPDSTKAQVDFYHAQDVFPGTTLSQGTFFTATGSVATATPGLYQTTSGSIQLDGNKYKGGTLDPTGTLQYGDFTSYSVNAGYGIDTLVHEAGHLVGLGHTGPYNFSSTPANNIPAPPNQQDTTDVRTWSIMSYIDPNATGANAGSKAAGYSPKVQWGYDSAGSTRTPLTPMGLDVIAAQRLLGAPTSTTFGGHQTFGFNSNVHYIDASGTQQLMSAYNFNLGFDSVPIVTLYDYGPQNTLDLSLFATSSTVDLNDGKFSSVATLTDNIFIEWGTTIDTAIGGSANDSFTVNGDSDTIDGGDGVNTVYLPQARGAYVYTRAGNTIILTDTLPGHSEVESLSRIQQISFAGAPAVSTATLASIVWTGSAGNGVYNTAANWDLAQVPAIVNDVTIGAGFTVDVTKEPANSIDSLQLAATAQFSVDVGHFYIDNAATASNNAGTLNVGQGSGSATLYMSGTFNNAGVILLYAAGSVLQTNGGTTSLLGAGTLRLANGSVGGSGGGVTLDTFVSSNTIRGFGSIGGNTGFLFPLLFQNIGVVNADDVLPITLTGSIVNKSQLIASSIGGLSLDGGINNAGGTITASGSSTVSLDAGSTAGGLIQSTGAGTLAVTGNYTLDGTASPVTLGGDVIIQSGKTLTLLGTIAGGTIDASAGFLTLNSANLQGTKVVGAAGHVKYAGNNAISFRPFTSNGFTLDSPLTIAPGNVLSYSDPTNSHPFVDHSVLTLAASVGIGATLLLDGQLNLNGGGTIALGGAGALITGQGVGPYYDMLFNEGATISGAGAIGGLREIYNDALGTIIANGGSLVLSGNSIANVGWMGAAAGADLVLLGTLNNNAVSQGTLGGAGLITFGGTLNGTPVLGGLRQGALLAGGTVDFAGPGGSFQGVQNGGTVLVRSGASLTLLGSLDNGGVIRTQGLNDANPAHVSAIVVTGDVSLTSAGTIVLQGIDSISGGTLENIANTLQGGGRIGAGLLVLQNSGSIVANLPAAPLVLDGGVAAMTNGGLLAATSGATLQINSLLLNYGTFDFGFGTPSRTTGGTISASGIGSLVTLNTTVSNGLLSSDSGGRIQVSQVGTLQMGVPAYLFPQQGQVPPYAENQALSNYADLRVLAGATLALIGDGATPTTTSAYLNNFGSISLRGSIDVVSGSHVPAQLLVKTVAVTIAGTGIVTLADSSDMIIGASTADLLDNRATIAGVGKIGAGLLRVTNYGTIDATSPNIPLYVQSFGTFTNNGTLATGPGGGTLVLEGIIRNGGFIANLGTAGSGVVVLGGPGATGTPIAADMIGGNIRAGATLITSTAGSTLDGSFELVNLGRILVVPGTSLSLGGYLSQSGILELQASIDPVSKFHTGATLSLAASTVDIQLSFGQVLMDDISDRIVGTAGQSLILDGNSITGAGHIGEGGMAFSVNDFSSVVNATGSLWLDVAGTSINNGTIEATAGGTLIVAGSIANAGIIAVTLGSSVQIAGGVTGSGSLSFAGGALKIMGEVGTQSVYFSGLLPDTLELGTPGSMAGTINNFLSQQTIDLDGIQGATFTYANQVLHVKVGTAELATLTFNGSYSANGFKLIPDGHGGTNVVSNVACFAAGTRILTGGGEVAVEALRVGDRVVTVNAGGRLARIAWIGHTSIDLARHPQPDRIAPVRIEADAVAPGMPHRDLLLSPDHAIYLGGRLLPVHLLINGASIRREPARGRIGYFHIELDRHAVLLADGLPAESYLDTGNRSAFANGGVQDFAPDFARPPLAIWAQQGCAELVLGGAEAVAAHRRLVRRAAALGHRLTADPGLDIRADGRPLALRQIAPGRLEALVPAGTRGLRVRSRSVVPQERDPALDDRRRLGVALISVTLDGFPLELDGPGFHPREPELCWTDGDSHLALPFGGGLLHLAHVTGLLAYPERTDRTKAKASGRALFSPGS